MTVPSGRAVSSHLQPIETASAEEMRAMQLSLLRRQLEYVAARSSFYRDAFRGARVSPDDLRTLDDLRRFPLTTKNDLRERGSDFVCAEPGEIYDYGATTGTTGPPVLLPATLADWDGCIGAATRALGHAGIGPGDIVQISAAFDQLFMVGLPIDMACKRLGAATVRMGPGNTGRQVEILKRTRATWLACGAQYALALAAEAAAQGLDPTRDFALRAMIVLIQAVRGPGWQPNALHRKIDEAWGLPLFAVFGSMETYAGFYDCPHFGGHHTYWDRHFFEILDPGTLEPVPDSEVGELVFTHLNLRGIPLVRFRQGDLTRLETAPCACGKTAPRIMEILGRTDEMLKIKGISVYPRQIEEAIIEVPGVESYVVEVDIDETGRERIVIRIAVKDGDSSVPGLVRARVQAQSRLTPIVTRCTAEEVQAAQFALGTRKAKTFWDRRQHEAHSQLDR